MSICGYGREEPEADWIAYGDDAAIAAGLSQVLWDCTATPMFCGDAIADPLAGMHAALAAWSSYLGGGGRLLCVALCDVVAHCIEFAALGDRDAMRARLAQWSACISAADVAVPGARPDHGKARPLGADTHAVLSGLGIRC